MNSADTPVRFVIIGGVAAGASAAARARRLSEKASIIVLERGTDVSFANCGMPYYIGGEIAERGKLAIQTPQSLLRILNLDVRVRTEAIRIDRRRKVVVARGETGEAEIPYDKLLLAPGAKPIRPPLPGIDDERILTLRTLQDMDKIREKMGKARKIAVIGAGFIGLEMVEALASMGKEVTLVEKEEQVLPQMDPEMVKRVEIEIVNNGVEIVLGDGIAGFHPSPESITVRLSSGKTVEVDLVILSIGVQCESQLASAAGIELGIRGAIAVNEFQQTSDPDIYAAGDAAETADPILGKRIVVPLAGPANRQGRVVADHIFLGEKAKPYPGTIGTAIVRVFDVAAGFTGYTEKRLRAENVPYRSTTIAANQHADYYPGALPVAVKVLWAPGDGRLLGAQAVGCEGVDKRIDVLAAAIFGELGVDDLSHLELSYAPPFGSARDLINLAGFAAQNLQNGLLDPVYSLPKDSGAQIIDVRAADMARIKPIAGTINIPYDQLRGRLGELDRKKPVVTVCSLGKMSYFAHRLLHQHGFDVKCLIGGMDIRSQKPSCTPNASTASCKGNPM